jgi:hypothetical protein
MMNFGGARRDLRGVKVGDAVRRMLAGSLPMDLKVTAVDDDFIHCGPWKFDRTTGAEVDEDLGWGLPDKDGAVHTGSFLVEA